MQKASDEVSIQILLPLFLASAGALTLFIEPSISRKRVESIKDSSGVRERLSQIGRTNSYESFRIKQVTQSLVAISLSFLAIYLLSQSLFVATLLGLTSGIALYYLIDWQLSQEVKKYQQRIEDEFPAVVEMLTLALSAGETPLGAITRISKRAHGLIGNEFELVISAVRNGTPFHVALDAFSRRIDSIVIRRFIDALITAMLRGAPLIDVLSRHASEARSLQRNLLMDKAGKAEISMMIPVVFLILPISILFALYPSMTHLNLFAG